MYQCTIKICIYIYQCVYNVYIMSLTKESGSILKYNEIQIINVFVVIYINVYMYQYVPINYQNIYIYIYINVYIYQYVSINYQNMYIYQYVYISICINKLSKYV